MLRKRAISLLVVVPIALAGLTGLIGASAAGSPPVATASHYCSAYAEEHFHDRNAQTPGGVKCLGVGEYCSHKPGYPAAYRRAGFRCNSAGRLEET